MTLKWSDRNGKAWICMGKCHRRRGLARALRGSAAYRRIRRIEFMALPKAISGNIPRVELRARENSCQPEVSAGEYPDR
jgi:acyl-coenzyme A synthetase/AMP-(fatty) acid ligase